MKFKITHSTDYIFSSDVFLEPHYLRFRPKQTSYLDVLGFSLDIQPKPFGHKILQDEENNILDFCWFEGVTNKFSVKAESILEIKSFNPFDFILQPQRFNELPFRYDTIQENLLFSTLESRPLSHKLNEYGNSLLEASNFNTIEYLTNLTNQLHNDFKVEFRADGSPLIPDETFELKRGSCRDLAWMQIQLLRQQGIAARFVSGYYYFEMDKPEYELHAWLEVFLPGTGWLGLDPSHGILTGNTHFSMATSANYEQTMPVSGGIRGSASSELITQLSIEKI